MSHELSTKIMYPDLKEFISLTKKGNLIPVYDEILADLETPVSAFLKIENKEFSYLLESVEGEEKVARFSFLGSEPSIIFSSKGKYISITTNKYTKRFVTEKDPLNELKKLMSVYKFVPVKGLPRFCGGMVGFIGYDMVRFFEKLPSKNSDGLNMPDSIFMFTDTILIFDHANHKIKIVSNVYVPDSLRNNKNKIAYLYSMAVKRINLLKNEIEKPLVKNHAILAVKKPIMKSNFSKKEFCRVVRKAKDYIHRGDIIQVVLSQRFKIKELRPSFDIYRNLRSINPSPYMFYLKMGKIILMGSSPELLVRCEDGALETRPIAGTRPRGANEEEDKVLREDLLKDNKERAEHVMLVDLGRNDIGRVSSSKSVKVKNFMNIEKYSHVMHIVSEVVGKLKKDKTIFDALVSCFPAGTVSGAPKVRAMEIIEELENSRRSVYAGSVGYFSFSGNLDTCITIRSVLVKDGFAYVQAGAGIVADSVPEKEYVETINKAKAQLKAITG